jgi:hypothetical protein
MAHPFNAQQGLIIVQAEVEGPTGTASLRLALDSGATDTLLNAAKLRPLGYPRRHFPLKYFVDAAGGKR